MILTLQLYDLSIKPYPTHRLQQVMKHNVTERGLKN